MSDQDQAAALIALTAGMLATGQAPAPKPRPWWRLF